MAGLLLSILISALLGAQPEQNKRYLTFGIFIGSIEEGAQIFTPTRFLPFDHPEALGHQFPTALQLYGAEYPLLVWLGLQAGYRLRTTLQRYPREPSPDWPYIDFAPPPDSSGLHGIPITHHASGDSPLPGLRAVLFIDRNPVCFIVDTRTLTLKERRMSRATSMGLDLTRAEFLKALTDAADDAGGKTTAAVIFDP